jgi:hypothetical protein
VGIQQAAHVGGVLAEPAGAVCRRQEEHRARRVGAGLFEHPHEVADRDLGRVALVAGGELRAQFALRALLCGVRAASTPMARNAAANARPLP